MYAVIESGGKQYRVQAGDIIQVEKLDGDVGTEIKFENILFASKTAGETTQVWVGKPLLAGAAVQSEVVAQGRGEKLLIIKMKRRKQYRRTQGHRQFQTQLLIKSVSNGAGETETLSAVDMKTTLSKFHTMLKPVGLAHTPKTLGSRKRMAARITAEIKAGTPKAEKKPAAKKTSAKAAK